MARSDLEKIAKQYIAALWVSRDLRRLHLRADTAEKFIALVNRTVRPLRLTLEELPEFQRIVRRSLGEPTDRQKFVLENLSPADNGLFGHGPTSDEAGPPSDSDQTGPDQNTDPES